MKPPKTARRNRFNMLLQKEAVKVGNQTFHDPKLNAVPFANKRPLVLGIDPGYSGALSLFNPTTKELLAIKEMPLTNDGWGKKEVVLNELVLFLEEWSEQIAFAAMEKVHSMPDQGVASMFNFGMWYGALRGLLAANFIQTFLVRPQDWKQAMKLINKDKSWSRNLAMDMFPKSKDEFKRAKDDGKAESALIAVYGALYCGREISPGTIPPSA